MKREMAWVLATLALVLSGITALYFWKQQPSPARTPLFLSVGEITAFAGGNQRVKTTIHLELKNSAAHELASEQMPRIKWAITRDLSKFPERQIVTAEGKLKLQQRIRQSLDKLLGEQAVREVLFSDFVVSTI